MAKISVIIPAYNAEKTVEVTVRNVLASTIPVDVWVVDDGSTDGTGTRIEQLAREFSGMLSMKDRACRKIDEWLDDVTARSFTVALEKLTDECVAIGKVRLRNMDERDMIISGARRFFEEFSSRIVELGDGRCVYFAPDPRARNRNITHSEAWAEYAIHAVTNGGVALPDGSGHVRWYNHRKVENLDALIPTLKAERCAPGIKSNPSADSIDFFGETHEGGDFVVVVRLDEYGNANANMTEVTFEAGKPRKRKHPRLKPLSEAVEAVVRHQAAGTNPPTSAHNVSNYWIGRKGGLHILRQSNCGAYQARLNALKRITTPYFGFVDADDTVEPDMFEKMVAACEANNLDCVQCKIVGDREGDMSGSGTRVDKSLNSAVPLNSPTPTLRILERESLLRHKFHYLVDAKESCFIWDKVYRNQYDFSKFEPTDKVTNFDDMIFNFQFFAKIRRMGFLDEGLYHYNQTAGSAVHSFGPRQKHDFKWMARNHWRMTKELFPNGEYSKLKLWIGHRKWFWRNFRNAVITAVRAK